MWLSRRGERQRAPRGRKRWADCERRVRPHLRTMEVHHLDPAFTTVERIAPTSSRQRDRPRVRALLWLIQLSNWVLSLGPADPGVVCASYRECWA